MLEQEFNHDAGLLCRGLWAVKLSLVDSVGSRVGTFSVKRNELIQGSWMFPFGDSALMLTLRFATCPGQKKHIMCKCKQYAVEKHTAIHLHEIKRLPKFGVGGWTSSYFQFRVCEPSSLLGFGV